MFRSSLKPQFLSQLFHPAEAIPKGNIPTSCKSIKLMLKNGLISHSSAGIFNLMPFVMISLEKLCAIIDSVMKSVGGQKVLFPTLTQTSLWKKSGRLKSPTASIFKVKDRQGIEYCLSPTHEEVATAMVGGSVLPIKSLPLRIYQISTKFRDEVNPKLGLLRGREFIMKDMYTFDVSEDEALLTYSDVCEAYSKLFDLLGVNYVKVRASSAGMGGYLSHEYHFLSNVGEDEVLVCPSCKKGINKEILGTNEQRCSECNDVLQKNNGIEVGHAFYLGTTYSKPFSAVYKSEDGTQKELVMGCYGLGVTRILAAVIECLSTQQDIRWPFLLTPFLISVIPPKKGSKEEKAHDFVGYLFDTLSNIDGLQNSLIIDDRTNLTIGKRVQDANSLGIPYSVIAGSTVLDVLPKVEVISNYNNKRHFMTHLELISYFSSIKNIVFSV